MMGVLQISHGCREAKFGTNYRSSKSAGEIESHHNVASMSAPLAFHECLLESQFLALMESTISISKNGLMYVQSHSNDDFLGFQLVYQCARTHLETNDRSVLCRDANVGTRSAMSTTRIMGDKRDE